MYGEKELRADLHPKRRCLCAWFFYILEYQEISVFIIIIVSVSLNWSVAIQWTT